MFRYGDADLHSAIGFVSSVILVGPPDTRADSLAGRHDEMFAKIVASPRDPTNPRWIPAHNRNSFIKHFDLIFRALRKFLFKHHPVDVAFAFEFEF